MRLRQQGATLVVVLIMLVILTLFGISAINLSNANLKVIGNMQARKQTEAAAMQAAEQVMSSMAPFNSPVAVVSPTMPTGYNAKVSYRVCQIATAASGYSAVQPIVPEDTSWDFWVEVSDNLSGARAKVWQGTKIRMLSGGCSTGLVYQ